MVIDYNVGNMMSPLGLIEYAVSDASLIFLEFGKLESTEWNRFRQSFLGNETDDKPEILFKVQLELNEYFMGERTKFTLPLYLHGTEFQLKVWNALLDIKFGQTTSYLGVSRKIKKPGASRAVGSANGKNPIPIIVPCHRVIQADNSLGGYTGGLDIKRFLLQHEGIRIKN